MNQVSWKGLIYKENEIGPFIIMELFCKHDKFKYFRDFSEQYIILCNILEGIRLASRPV